MYKKLMLLFVLAVTLFAQQLHVDSVVVDTVWNSDSSWFDGQGIWRQRISRDCLFSFIPKGEGMAKCSLVVSFDSGQTWSLKSDSVVVAGMAFPVLVNCGNKSTIRIRILGDDRVGVVFRIIARQSQPFLYGKPKINILGMGADLKPGNNCFVELKCQQNIADSTKGYSSITKIYWDANGDGSWNDSTSTLNWVWQTAVPMGVLGQRRAVIVKARDFNGLWCSPETLTVQFGLKRSLNMLEMSGGTFMMGSDVFEFERPVHRVILSAFKISQTHITQEIFMAVMNGVNPSLFGGDTSALRPVDNVNWYDAVLFCNALSKLVGKDTVYAYSSSFKSTVPGSALEGITYNLLKNGYRLPTEAEWEYACKAGSGTDYYWGRNCSLLTSLDTANIDSNAIWWHNSTDKTWPVGTKKPNAWALYDMVGNVRQWCNDNFDYYFQDTLQTNPTGPLRSIARVQRGGSYNRNNDHLDLRSASRDYNVPTLRHPFFGFRVVSRP